MEVHIGDMVVATAFGIAAIMVALSFIGNRFGGGGLGGKGAW